MQNEQKESLNSQSHHFGLWMNLLQVWASVISFLAAHLQSICLVDVTMAGQFISIEGPPVDSHVSRRCTDSKESGIMTTSDVSWVCSLSEQTDTKPKH